jgi:predicted restriction endonuclease
MTMSAAKPKESKRSQRGSSLSPKASISWGPERKGIVSPVHADPPRLRLDGVLYERLRQEVLRRDGWRCQLCGTMSNLEVHHRQFRSHSGDDSEENLITLCAKCHLGIHR